MSVENNVYLFYFYFISCYQRANFIRLVHNLHLTLLRDDNVLALSR